MVTLSKEIRSIDSRSGWEYLESEIRRMFALDILGHLTAQKGLHALQGLKDCLGIVGQIGIQGVDLNDKTLSMGKRKYRGDTKVQKLGITRQRQDLGQSGLDGRGKALCSMVGLVLPGNSPRVPQGWLIRLSPIPCGKIATCPGAFLSAEFGRGPSLRAKPGFTVAHKHPSTH